MIHALKVKNKVQERDKESIEELIRWWEGQGRNWRVWHFSWDRSFLGFEKKEEFAINSFPSPLRSQGNIRGVRDADINTVFQEETEQSSCSHTLH